MRRHINHGGGWTLLAVECWMRVYCSGCVYSRYCIRGEYGKSVPTIMSEVVSMLVRDFGDPPQKLIDMAIEQKKRPIILKVEKK